MIIRFPTGLYSSILPSKPEDSGNITFTISNQDPPRSTNTFLQQPLSEQLRSLPDKIFTDSERRITFGELVFSIISATNSAAGSGKQQFEVGDLIEFGESEILGDVGLEEAPTIIEVRHDTNVLDLDGLGLSEADIDDIVAKAEIKKSELEEEILITKTAISNTRVKIAENQKTINETNKALGASLLIYLSDHEIIIKLNETLASLILERTELTTELKTLNTESSTLYGQLLEISQVVR